MSEQKKPKEVEVPVEFYKIMKDFLNDILTTFPEYEEVITEEENFITIKYNKDASPIILSKDVLTII